MAILYVKSGSTGNGSAWNNAYGSLQSAITAAQAGDEIWVAAGTYKPTTGTDRTASFTLKNNVAIYGGFAGTETARNQRNIATNATILSGEIGIAGIADNAYHVVSATGTISTPLGNSSILDGFTITGGNANGTTGNQDDGGGMYVSGASPTLRNITFRDNNGTNGGALYNENGSNPVLTDVLFEYNTATRGAAIYDDLSSPQITNGTFRLNTAINDGGAIYNTSSSNPTIVDSVFSRNSANTGSGGAIFSNLSNPNFINTTFSNNVAITGGAFSNTSSSVAIRNSILYGNQNSSGTNTAQISGGGVTVANSIIQGGGFTGATDNDPLFVNAKADDLRLKAGSPALNAGDVNLLPADSRDLDGDGDTTLNLKKRSKNIVGGLTLSLIALTTTLTTIFLTTQNSNATPTLIGPSGGNGLSGEYYRFEDSPFFGQNFDYFYLENFEDGLLNTPGVTASSASGLGVLVTSAGFFQDSVDIDDGIIDGNGQQGHSLIEQGNGAIAGIRFYFNKNILGSFPTHAGIVWTDSSFGGPSGTDKTPLTFSAFDVQGNSLGSIALSQGQIGDNKFDGTTIDDRFFGVINLEGISSILISQTLIDRGFSVDHLQYGLASQSIPDSPNVPEPSTILGILTLGLGALLSKKHKQNDIDDD